MTSRIFSLLVAGATVISLSATAADGEKQQPSQAHEQSEGAQQAHARPSAAAQAAALNPSGGPSSSSERTAEPAPGGYGPPAGEPPSGKTK